MTEKTKKVEPQRWFEGGWFREPSMLGLIHIQAGYYPEIPPNIHELVDSGQAQILDYRAYRDLLDYIRKNETGILQTDRTEDLKIINRLLDIVQIHANKTTLTIATEEKVAKA